MRRVLAARPRRARLARAAPPAVGAAGGSTETPTVARGRPRRHRRPRRWSGSSWSAATSRSGRTARVTGDVIVLFGDVSAAAGRAGGRLRVRGRPRPDRLDPGPGLGRGAGASASALLVYRIAVWAAVCAIAATLPRTATFERWSGGLGGPPRGARSRSGSSPSPSRCRCSACWPITGVGPAARAARPGGPARRVRRGPRAVPRGTAVAAPAESLRLRGLPPAAARARGRAPADRRRRSRRRDHHHHEEGGAPDSKRGVTQVRGR